MSSFPTSFHLKNERRSMSLLENEADMPVHEKTKLTGERSTASDDEKIVNRTQSNDIIATAGKPVIRAPSGHPPQEPVCLFRNAFRFVASAVLNVSFYTCLPILSASFAFVGLFPRLLVKLVLCISDGGKLRLLPVSRVYGSIVGNTHTVMLICRGRCDIEKIRAYMLTAINSSKDSRNGHGKYENLQKRVTAKFGYLCLENRSAHFDIKNHVRHYDIRSKNVIVDADEIIPYLASTYNEPFDNHLTAPQWEVLLVPKYGIRHEEQKLISPSHRHDNNMYALIFRFHNGLMDWSMFQELLIDYFGKTDGQVNSIFSTVPKNGGFWRQLKTKVVSLLVGPPAFLRNIFTIWKEFAGLKPLDNKGKISFAVTRPISCEAVEDVKERTHTGFASILGSCLRTSIRNMVLGQNMDFPQCSTVSRTFHSMDNQHPGLDSFSVNFQKFRNCIERLQASYHYIDREEIQLRGQRDFNRIMIQLAAILPYKLSAWLYKTLMKADVALDICPGADEPCTLFEEDILEDIYAWSGIAGTDANFKVTVTTYCGRARINVIGKLGELSGGLADAQIIANEFEVEYEHLASAVGLYPQQLYIPPIVTETNGMYSSQ